MCNINVIFRKDRKNVSAVKDYMNFASYNSYSRNDDADGYFLFKDDEYVIDKSLKKVKVKDNCWFICSHQRLATSGKPEESIHPFETKDFILVHNGVFDEMGYYDKSDTREFVEKLQSNYKGRMIEAIQKTTSEVSGRFSIVVYDKNEDRVYYFKEKGTDMFVVENDEYLVMSTIEENLQYACYLFDIDEKEIQSVNENIIIDVLNGFKNVGQFKEKTRQYYYGGYTKPYWSYWGEDEEDEEEKEMTGSIDAVEPSPDKRLKIPERYWEYSSDRGRYLTIEKSDEYPKGDWRNDEKICKQLKQNENGGLVKWL